MLVRPRFRVSEAFRPEVFETHDGGVTQVKLERTHRISAATTERWYQGYCRPRLSEMSNRPCPKVLSIGEHFFTCKRDFAKTLVDLQRNKVFDVRPGRSEASLEGNLRRSAGIIHWEKNRYKFNGPGEELIRTPFGVL